MSRKVIVLGLVMALLLLLPSGAALATPTPPYVFVNHATKECAVHIHGDDCSWCEPPEGWLTLGEQGQAQCPAGYTRVENLQFNCERYKNQFCCSGGPHRGNCEDMVVNDSQSQCAFVENIAGCVLPAGWAGRPANVKEWNWNCPFNYSWGNMIACLPAAPTPESTLTPTPKPPGGVNGLGCLGPAVALGIMTACAVTFFGSAGFNGKAP